MPSATKLSTSDAYRPQQNHLLAALSSTESERLFPELDLVPVQSGHLICESGSRSRYLYFPVDCIVSLSQPTQDGTVTEIAAVGNEGMVGIAQLMSVENTPSQAMVQSTGHTFRAKLEVVQAEFARGATLHHQLLRYTQALLTQMAQGAVCNRHHRVEHQLCRWLLLSLDRLSSNEICITHESIADTLGVRREAITQAARKLRDAGCIRYRRKHFTVIDRHGLESRACECYAVIKKELDSLRLQF